MVFGLFLELVVVWVSKPHCAGLKRKTNSLAPVGVHMIGDGFMVMVIGLGILVGILGS